MMHRCFAKRLLPIASCLLITLALTVAPTAHAEEVPSRPISPRGSLMVLNINMAEVFEPADIADQTDVAHLAERSAQLLPYVPDVVLVQEVNNVAAENVASQLGRVTGHRFAVAGPELGDTSIYKEGTATTPRVVRESTVIVNLDTVGLLDSGPWMEFSYDHQYTGEGYKWVTNSGAHVLVHELSGGLRAAVSSLHYQPRPRFDPIEAGMEYKAEWTKQIDRTLGEAYPSPSRRQVMIVGGDFNNRPCVNSGSADDPDCEPSPLWTTATQELGWSTAVNFGIDHIFSSGAVSQSGSDKEVKRLIGTRQDLLDCLALYDDGRSAEATGGCAAHYYSDHNMVWGLIGMRKGR